MLVLHGGLENPAFSRLSSGMAALADRATFVAVFPAGTSPLFEDRLLFWHTEPKATVPADDDADDVAFLRGVLDDLARHALVDERRVFAAGLSNGGHMAMRLGCELGDRISAVAVVAGPRLPTSFQARRPLPLMLVHGLLDPLLAYDGRQPASSPLARALAGSPSAPAAAAAWAAHNGADAAHPLHLVRGAATRTTFVGPAAGEVMLWSVADGGHTWPGGTMPPALQTGRLGVFPLPAFGPVSHALDASAEIWDFFQRHPRR